MNSAPTTAQAPYVAESSFSTIARAASTRLTTQWGVFDLHGFQDRASGREHAALSMGDVADGEPVLARLHSECLTGDTLFSLHCDCGAQLHHALQRIAEEKRGVLLYLRQEGRGIGLVDKIRAYELQRAGLDTVDANRALGLPDDARDYTLAADMLRYLGVRRVRLLTNNPTKVAALESLGLEVAQRVPLHAGRQPVNERYMSAKEARMGHLAPA